MWMPRQGCTPSSISLYFYVSITSALSIYPSTCLSVCLSVCPSLCLSVCLSVSLSVCLSNLSPTNTGTAFQSGDGLDLYVDGARFLPDNVTFSKVSWSSFFANTLVYHQGHSAEVSPFPLLASQVSCRVCTADWESSQFVDGVCMPDGRIYCPAYEVW